MRLVSCTAALAALALACSPAQSTNPEPLPALTPPGDVAASSQARLTTPAPGADLAAAVAGNTDFALELYRRLAAETPGNLFLSPQSISVALAMAYAGAAGATADAFERVLHLGLPAAAYHRAMNDLDRQLTSRGQGATAADGQPFRLTIANQLFAERTFRFQAPFLDTLALEYGANVRLMDFVSAPDPSRVQINTWVSDRTEGRIADLLPPGSVSSDTRAVLVNAIYFNASWAKQFDPAATSPKPFHALDGSTPSVPTMFDGQLPARGATVDGVEVVALPYDGRELAMVLLMPPAGQFEAFEQQLTAAKLSALLAATQHEELALALPRFEFRTSKSLAAPLSRLGLGPAFSEGADFSAMSTDARLALSDVVHEAFVKVDEQGTEAAAATAVIVGVTSVPVIRPVTVDRPFLFAIRDEATGALVFVGRVVNPA